jgi:ATPase subunit of ABC transporter with duplicated ATPase domains
MIVVKNLRADVRTETLFERVNVVIQSGERLAMVGSSEDDATLFLRILAGDAEMDEGTVATEGERVVYVGPEALRGSSDALAQILHARPTFLILDGGNVASAEGSTGIRYLMRGFKGGMLIASADANLMREAKTTRVLELQTSLKTVTSYTGSYDTYLVEKEKNDARANEAYKKQQREKRRLEEWLEQKRKEASVDRSPEKGATIRAKVKYLQREILSKEIPRPASLDGAEEVYEN